MKLNKGILVSTVNKVDSSEGSNSLPVVFKEGDNCFEFDSIESVDGKIVIELVPAELEEKVKEEPKEDTAEEEKVEPKKATTKSKGK